MKNCFKYYQQYKDQFNCERGKTKHGALANILVCLEKAIDEGNTVLLFDDITFSLSRDLFQLDLHFYVLCKIIIQQSKDPIGHHANANDRILDMLWDIKGIGRLYVTAVPQ